MAKENEPPKEEEFVIPDTNGPSVSNTVQIEV